MKNLFKLLLLLFSLTSCFSQENKKDLYILIDNKTQVIAEKDGYTFTLYIKSKDKRFSHDVYTFKVMNEGFELKPLKELSKSVSLDKISVKNQSDFFNDMMPCESHEKLSLDKIYLVKEIPKKNKSDVQLYRYWSVIYCGTQKDIIKTAPDFPNKEYFEE